MRKLFIFCVLLLLAISCSAPYYMKRGNAISETGRFHKASSKFEKAYEKAKTKPDKSNIAVRVGQENEKVYHLQDAYSWYQRAVRDNEEQPEVYLKLAQICLNMGQVENARNFNNKYEELFGDGKGEDGLYYLEQIITEQKNKGRYNVHPMKVFNSRNSDFSPMYFPGDTNQVYFASTRKPDPTRRRMKIDPITDDGYSHIFHAEFVHMIRSVDKKGKIYVRRFTEPRWLRPVLLTDSLLSNKHEGAMCFTADGEQMYITSSRTIKGANVGTRIYKVTKKNNVEDEFGKVEWTSISLAGICGDSVSVGHPAITLDGNRMYFVSSELPDGFGGKDIWYVDLMDGKWGTPVNAGEMINTAGDEMFPYIRDNGELYFSSNGRYGFGGLDIYKIEKDNGTDIVRHLPFPLNSYADDFGIVFKPGEESGLFTSFRSGRSDDIYSFSFIPQKLDVKILAINEVTEEPIANVSVTVTVDDGNIYHLQTDSIGMANMPLDIESEYIFVTEHAKYLKGKGVVSTYDEKGDHLYELIVSMQAIERPIVIPNIYFDVAKWDLRPDAMENLGILLEILKDNPSITIEISAHTDMVGHDVANMLLSENRARSVVDYLIEKGIYWDRLESKGYGESQPRQINEKDAREYDFLKTGDVLNEGFINNLKGSEEKIALQLNRRIEFKVLRTDYKPGPNSLHNPNRRAIAAGDKGSKNTQLRAISSIKGEFYTLQVGMFMNIPLFINQFDVVFTEKLETGAMRYYVKIYETHDEAAVSAQKLKEQGIDCFVKGFNQKNLHTINQRAVAAEEIDDTQLKELSDLKDEVYTLQLGIFSNRPPFINYFKEVFTENLENGAVRYCVEVHNTYNEANISAQSLKEQGFDCFVKKLNQKALQNFNRSADIIAEGEEEIGKTKFRRVSRLKGDVYTLQLGIFLNEPPLLEHFEEVFTEKLENGAKRYYVGAYNTYNEASVAAQNLKKEGVDCFVKRLNQEPLQELTQRTVDAEDREDTGATQFKELSSLEGEIFTLQVGMFMNAPTFINQFDVVFTEKLASGAVRYFVGIHTTYAEASVAAQNLKGQGIDCFVKTINQ